LRKVILSATPVSQHIHGDQATMAYRRYFDTNEKIVACPAIWVDSKLINGAWLHNSKVDTSRLIYKTIQVKK